MLTCFRRNCLHSRNVTFGTPMPGRRHALLRPCCRRRLCHCGYVIRHLVASMHNYFAHLNRCRRQVIRAYIDVDSPRRPTCRHLWPSDSHLWLAPAVCTDVVPCSLHWSSCPFRLSDRGLVNSCCSTGRHYEVVTAIEISKTGKNEPRDRCYVMVYALSRIIVVSRLDTERKRS